jgi:HSP20 family protein
MEIAKLSPWNWFKKEQDQEGIEHKVPVRRPPPGLLATSHPLLQIHDEIDQLFDQMVSDFYGTGPFQARKLTDRDQAGTALTNPKIDILSDNDHYQITVEAPGISADAISIELEDNVLVIKADYAEDKEDNQKHYYRKERFLGSFQRMLSLPDDADKDQVEASMNNGLLEVRIARRKPLTTDVKRIPIRH